MLAYRWNSVSLQLSGGSGLRLYSPGPGSGPCGSDSYSVSHFQGSLLGLSVTAHPGVSVKTMKAKL